MSTSEKLFERVTRQIRQDIAEGKFPAGEKIPAEPELMSLYKVGRSTIREAIKTLSISGILKVQQGFGTVVNPNLTEPIEQRLQRAEFKEINAVRSLLEIEILKLALQNHQQADLNLMVQSLEKRKLAIQAEQREDCVNADIEFHMAIAHASANGVLADLYQSFTSIIRDFFSKREPKGVTHFAMSHHLHEQLYTAIKEKKSELALEILSTILNNNH
ncbi:FadR/GntR family transcriptional regulator [Pedobacter nototheniae]|uniref:FadR/GntR family transcriptional regulator n=1 Tax=Pedobacter nototheniae TaxID=2488994 RepID=UPI00293188BA|nr:FCD domain-containing protein [Pedobacter nototheniae]